MQINFNFSVNEKELQKELEEKMALQAKGVMKRQVESFFAAGYPGHPAGIGYKDIETFLVNKWADPKFQARLENFFEENWERMLTENLEKAIHHRLRGLAFEHAKTLKIIPTNQELKEQAKGLKEN